eukprot:s2826_g3.t1
MLINGPKAGFIAQFQGEGPNIAGCLQTDTQQHPGLALTSEGMQRRFCLLSPFKLFPSVPTTPYGNPT